MQAEIDCATGWDFPKSSSMTGIWLQFFPWDSATPARGNQVISPHDPNVHPRGGDKF